MSSVTQQDAVAPVSNGAASLLAAQTISGLDGVRAIAILAVMIAHYGYGAIVPGGLGVTIFFFVSGFLITTLLLREQARSGTVDLRNFYVRRALRLGPELYLFVLTIAAIAYVNGTTIRPIELTAALFYFTNYYNLVSGMCISHCADWHMLWTLAVEEHFYLAFPLLVLLVGRNAQTLLTALAAVLVACLLWRTALVLFTDVDRDWTYKATDARIDSIAYGCFLAVALVRKPEWFAWAERFRWPLLCASAAIMAISLLVRDDVFRDTARYSAQGLSIGLGFVVLYATSLGATLRAVLDTPALAWVGRVSYGAYLWHFMSLAIVTAALGTLDVEASSASGKALIAFASTIVTFGFAFVSYECVARPAMRARRRFAPRAARKPEAVGSVARPLGGHDRINFDPGRP